MDQRESADRVLDAVLDRIDATPQRRAAWWLVWRFPAMNTTAKLAMGAAAVMVIVLLGIRLLVPGSPSFGSGPDPAETPSPTASPRQIPSGMTSLNAGRHSLGSAFPVGISFDLPAGWTSCSLAPLEQAVCLHPGTVYAPTGVGVGFLSVEDVVADPCNEASFLDPSVRPSIEDLATAISNLPGFEATTAEDVTLDGFAAKRFTVTAPRNAGCELSTWATPTRTNGVAAGEANLLYLIDVDGERVMISAAYDPSNVSDEQLVAAEEVIASVQIEAP
jgi:hypothetical protein